ncbi:hypothetical protein LDENG_00225920 [Lucifuga dentata]|nr:hypothetical protein LDENG_00225920 [Lucifuga dentata]
MLSYQASWNEQEKSALAESRLRVSVAVDSVPGFGGVLRSDAPAVGSLLSPRRAASTNTPRCERDLLHGRSRATTSTVYTVSFRERPGAEIRPRLLPVNRHKKSPLCPSQSLSVFDP